MLSSYKNQLTVLVAVFVMAFVILASTLILSSADFKIKNTGGTDPDGKFLNTVSVTGDGKVYVTPDMLTFSITATQTRDTSKEALEVVNQKISDIVKILKDKGIDEKDIQTSYLSISPEYDWTKTGRNLLGQKATQSLSIKVKNIDENATKAGEIIDEVSKISDVEVGSITFDVEDKTKSFSKARELAFDKAKQKAEELADLGDVNLGKPVSISDTSYDYSYPTARNVAYEAADSAGSVPSTDISTGQLELSISINVSFEIE
jgi:uncharacterized protein YggE